jgi:aldehyde dehydrogenase (NAD+)
MLFPSSLPGCSTHWAVNWEKNWCLYGEQSFHILVDIDVVPANFYRRLEIAGCRAKLVGAQIFMESDAMTTADGPGLLEQAAAASLFIDGRFVAGEGTRFAVENPATGETVLELNGASDRQVDAILASSSKAADGWADTPSADRVTILRAYIEALRRRADDVRDVLAAEAGFISNRQPWVAAVAGFQVQMPLRQASEILDVYLSLPETIDNPLPLHERVSAMGKSVQSIRRYSPVGVVAGVAAYNYPLVTAMWKVIPALVTGNCMILRPSPLTPISALIFAQAAEEVGLPAGVLNVLIEGGIEGAQALTTDPRVDMVAFTGSSGVGKLVMAQSAQTMKRLQLELGGKSAQIFLPDAIDQASMQALSVCLAHAGQGCVLGTRIFVPEESKAQVLADMKAAFEAIVIGGSDNPDAQMGPVISAAQVARCEHFVQLAVADGARIVTGGKRPAHLARGHFFEPTVLDTPDNDNAAAQEEVFGPVVSVIGYRDLDHAVAMANDTVYGLSGYVWGNDKATALKVATRLKTGTVNINGGGSSSWASSGGRKQSGIGRERGEEGIRLYQDLTVITLSA